MFPLRGVNTYMNDTKTQIFAIIDKLDENKLLYLLKLLKGLFGD